MFASRAANSSLPLLVMIALVASCGPEPQPTPDAGVTPPAACDGAKCDTPTDSEDYNWEDACTARRADVLEGNRETFTPDHIRWACADVEGVNARNSEDRGQEYCEYFAMIQLPDIDEDELTGPVIDLGRITEAEDINVATPLELELDDDQIDWYDDHSDDVVGHCVFTSWHVDFPEMACEETGDCPTVLGDVTVDAERFRMKVGFNSNFAARDLLKDCMAAASQGAYSTGLDDPQLDDDFLRGCKLADDLYQTGWRFSDSSICAAATRLAECGCGVEGAADLEEAVGAMIPSPEQQVEAGEVALRGFPLGGWGAADKLPSGCKYIETGDDAGTLVACEIYGIDVVDNANDPKEFCRKQYGDNIVVHVPIPQDKVICDAPEDGQYNQCSAQPWILQAQ